MSLGSQRAGKSLESFLDRMPCTSLVIKGTVDQPLWGIKVFLVHHVTMEVLGLIAALRHLGCRDITALFVSYAGEVSDNLLETILAISPDEFRCMAIVHVPDKKNLEGYYQLSSQYSIIDNEAMINKMLARKKSNYFKSMEAIAIAEFMRLAIRAESEESQCLVIEDGGYLSPTLNRACMHNRTVKDFVAEIEPNSQDERLLKDVLAPLLVGTVEHTLNGMNRLQKVVDETGKLAFPAFTIAISNHKRHTEAREVSISVLNAVEKILYSQGQTLSRRNCVVLGSKGAIGRHLVAQLSCRLIDAQAQLAGIDLLASNNGDQLGIPESKTIDGLPKAILRQLDLVIGVIGLSIFQGRHLEDWLLYGEPRLIYFASGSTKTEEFSELADWIDSLLAEPHPKLGGYNIQIRRRDIKDHLSGRLYAQSLLFEIETEDTKRQREVMFFVTTHVVIAG